MATIKNAIILAAGRGSRMRELTNDMPKCMMQVGSKRVIQNTIDILKYKNIKNIVIVTGYQSGILESYLRSLYDDLIFIENKEWESTNSMASMRLASKYLKNAIVIDSDIYVNNVDAIKTDIDCSGYSAIIDDRPNEWQLIAEKSNSIIGVEKSGSFHNGLPIIDISYWLEKDAEKIAKRINMCTFLNIENFDDKYWDEIPLLDFFYAFNLKRYDLKVEDAMEFDTPEDLEKVRKIACLAD